VGATGIEEEEKEILSVLCSTVVIMERFNSTDRSFGYLTTVFQLQTAVNAIGR
jgi:hypothetical protein